MTLYSAGTRYLFGYITAAIMLLAVAPRGAAQGYPGYPNTIMAPEPGAAIHHRLVAPTRSSRTRALPTPAQPREQRFSRTQPFVTRGSSGSVLPTPLPRTPLIPPEGSGTATVRIAPQQPGPTVLPGANPIPNLPHGTETFQDRASRCAFQQGLYNVPANLSAQYMGACLQ